MPSERPASVMVMAVCHFIVAGLGLLCCVCGIGISMMSATAQQAALADAAEQAAEQKERKAEGKPEEGKPAVKERPAPKGPRPAPGPGGDPFGGIPPERMQELQKKFERAAEQDIPQQLGAAAMLLILFGLLVYIVFPIMLIAAGIGLLNMRPWGRTLSIIYAVLSLLHKGLTAGLAIAYVIPALSKVFRDLAAAEDGQVRQGLEQFVDALQVMGYIPLIMMIYPLIVLIVMLSTGSAFRGEQSPEGFDRPPGGLEPESPQDPYAERWQS